MTILLAGCVGFIGARVAELLLARGDRVIGVDNLNDYHEVRLKRHRLEQLTAASRSGFSVTAAKRAISPTSTTSHGAQLPPSTSKDARSSISAEATRH